MFGRSFPPPGRRGLVSKRPFPFKGPAIRRGRGSLALLESPTTLDTLAAAFAEARNFEEAVRTQERVVALAEQGGSDSLDAYRGRLNAYERGKAWRADPPAVSEGERREGIATVEGGRVRSDTSLSSPILAQMRRGERVPVLDKEEAWYFVELEGDRFGWVHETVLSLVGRSPARAPEQETLVVKVDVARVREGPSPESPVAFRLKRDEPVGVSEKEGAWYFIKARTGRTGWAHESLFSRK